MNKNHTRRACTLASIAAGALCLFSCVPIDTTIGTNLIPSNQSFKTYVVDVPIEHIYMRQLDSLNALSTNRITIGAIRDPELGLTTRGSAFSIVPMYDSLDFGKPGTQVFQRFLLHAAYDTVSVSEPNQKYILQNVNVYELQENIYNKKVNDTNAFPKYDSSKRVSKGIPVINGSSNLAFEFSEEFGKKYMDITQEDLKDMDTYLKKFPGIYMDTDSPLGDGGRINIFNLQLDYEDNYLAANYAELKFSAEYGGTQKDTAFLFYFGADAFYDIDSLLSKTSVGYLPLASLNVTGHSSISKEMTGEAGEEIMVEGGGGVKPVILAEDIRQMMIDAISPYGNPAEAILNKASIILPFEEPEDYDHMDLYPFALSPGAKIRYSADSLQFFILTDYSDEDQDGGERNMSLLQYSPDFTYHAQSILRLKDTESLSNYDIWFLIQAEETYMSEAQGMDDETAELYRNMMYSSYYNNMYGGYGGYGGYGYGGYGYGGYGGYGNSYYNSYYYTAMLAQMYENAESTSEVTAVMLDKDRFYKMKLIGPETKGDRKPVLKLVFSVPEE